MRRGRWRLVRGPSEVLSGTTPGRLSGLRTAFWPCEKNLGLFANLRPVKVYPAIINSSPVKPHLLEGVDMMAIRELTGGLYFARPKKHWNTSRGRRAVDTLRYTEQEIERILRVGFELAMDRRKRLTSVDKANVLESSRLWREVAIELSERLSGSRAGAHPGRQRCHAANQESLSLRCNRGR